MKIIDGHDVIEHAEVNGESREFIRKLTDYIEDAPVVEPKQGKWIRKKSWSRGVGMGEVYGWYFECSVCGCLSEGSVNDAGNFCPNCGAKMEGADNE